MTNDMHTIVTEGLRRSWSRDTAYDPEVWSEARPSTGQCAVTALIVQDFLGGTIWRLANEEGSHYFNCLPSGEHLDLTLDQFDNPTFPASSLEERSREYLLSDLSTVARYSKLLGRFAEECRHLAEHYGTLTSLP